MGGIRHWGSEKMRHNKINLRSNKSTIWLHILDSTKKLLYQVAWNDRPTHDIYHHWHLPNLYINHSNTATKQPPPPALSLILLQRPTQDVNLPTSPQSIWFDVLVSTWFRLGESPQSKDEEREKDGQNSKFFYHLLFNTIQLCQTCVFGSSYRDPAAHLAHHWRSRRSCSKIECPPSLREVPGKMEWIFPEMLWKHCWGANQGKIVSLKPKAWTNRKVARINVFSCKKSQDICHVFRKFQKPTSLYPNPSSRPFSPAGSPFRCSKAPCVVFQAAHTSWLATWMSKRVQGDNGRGDATRCLKMSRDTEKTSRR